MSPSPASGRGVPADTPAAHDALPAPQGAVDQRNLGPGNPKEHAMTKSRDQKKESKKKPVKTAKEKKAEKNAKKVVKSFAPT
jgi:hypothetical protein